MLFKQQQKDKTEQKIYICWKDGGLLWSISTDVSESNRQYSCSLPLKPASQISSSSFLQPLSLPSGVLSISLCYCSFFLALSLPAPFHSRLLLASVSLREEAVVWVCSTAILAHTHILSEHEKNSLATIQTTKLLNTEETCKYIIQIAQKDT